MRVIGALVAVTAGIIPATALARPHDGFTVRDHRHESDSTPVVRDHRSHSDSHDSSPPAVRDHRGSHSDSDSGSSSGTTIIETTDVGYVSSPESSSNGPLFSDTGASWTIEVGGLARRFQGPGFTRHGMFTDGDVMSPYTLTSPSGDTASGAFALRATAPLSTHVYLGAELELGGLTRSPIQLMTDAPDLQIASKSMVGTAVVAGVRARQGIFEIGGEVAGGVRILSTSIQPYDYTEEDASATEAVASPVIETRLRAAVWVHPHVFLGAQVGVGVLDRTDRNIGFSLGIASRSYAGR